MLGEKMCHSVQVLKETRVCFVNYVTPHTQMLLADHDVMALEGRDFICWGSQLEESFDVNCAHAEEG